MLQRIVEGIKERTPPMRRVARTPVYMKDAYVDLLLRHYRQCGLPEPEWIKDIPDAPEVVQRSLSDPEPEIHFCDSVVVHLTPDEEMGEVRMHVSAAIADLYTNYYAKGTQPSIEEVVRAYSDAGYSEKYLIRLLSQYDAKLARIKRVDLDKIFKSDSGSKTAAKRAKKKEVAVVVEEEEDDDEVEDDEDDDMEEDPFDMEVEEEELEEAVEDDYESD